jgi:hypothetical protein
MPAVRGAMWRDRKGRRYVVLVNISGETQDFAFGEGADCKSCTIQPRNAIAVNL